MCTGCKAANTCEDCVDTYVQANGTIIALVVFDERLYKSRIRDDKAVERLCTVRCRYVHFVHDISDTRTRLSEFPSTCEAALTSV